MIRCIHGDGPLIEILIFLDSSTRSILTDTEQLPDYEEKVYNFLAWDWLIPCIWKSPCKSLQDCRFEDLVGVTYIPSIGKLTWSSGIEALVAFRGVETGRSLFPWGAPHAISYMSESFRDVLYRIILWLDHSHTRQVYFVEIAHWYLDRWLKDPQRFQASYVIINEEMRYNSFGEGLVIYFWGLSLNKIRS